MRAAPTIAAVDAYPYGLAATPDATRTAAASVTPRPSPTVWPKAPPARSRLFVDGAKGRVYASLSEGDRSELLVYDTRDGRLTARQPLQPRETLLDIDRTRGRLYLYRADRGVRLVSADDLAPIAAVALPTPDRADTFAGYIIFGPIDVLPPLVDPASGEILTIHGRTVTVHDPVSGLRLRAIEVPVPPDRDPVYRAAISDDGRILYLAVGHSSLADWTEQPGTVLLALDAATGDVIGRSESRALVFSWLSWGRNLVASTETYKDIGRCNRLWVDGRERRQVCESTVDWTVHDSRRDRVVGWYSTHRADGRISTLVSADPASLDLMSVGAGTRLGPPWILDESGRFFLPGPPTAYDAVTDRFYAWAADTDLLVVTTADALYAEERVTEAPVASQRLWGFVALSSVVDGSGARSPDIVAVARVTPALGTPTAEWAPEVDLPVILRAGADAWSAYYVPPSDSGWVWRRRLAPSPDYARDGTLFGFLPGVAVVRSTDGARSWAPLTAGLDRRAVQQIVVSPDYTADRTVLAVSFLGIQSEYERYSAGGAGLPTDDAPVPTPSAPSLWRSRDGGDRWEPLGRFAAPAFSPAFASDRTVMAFGYRAGDFHVSRDGGVRWQARGRLEEWPSVVGTRLWIVPSRDGAPAVLVALSNDGSAIGGSPHWDESGAAIYVSTDEGWTWARSWPESRLGVVAVDGDLVGPIPSASGEPSGWMLRLSGNEEIVLRSVDGGVRWERVQLPDDRGAWPIAALDGGTVLVAPGEPGLPRAVAPDAFETAPTATQVPPRR